MNNKICIIGVYFGTLRKDFSIWLKTCEYNPTIDFLIVTDNNLINLPSNVRQLNTSLEDLRLLASRKLELQVALYRPYKCCDLRPFYGKIFEDYLIDYGYWGHCDFDMVFGDLRYFFEKYDYTNYDHFLTQGHLALYRNSYEVSEHAKLSGGQFNYIKALTEDENVAFDENNCIGKIYLEHNLPLFKKNIYADLSPIYSRFRRSQFNWMDKVPKNYKHQIFVWEKGKTYQYFLNKGKVERKEMLYIHYQKRVINFDNVNDILEVSSFIITPKGYVPLSNTSNIDSQVIKRYDEYMPFRDTIELSVRYIRKYSKSFKRKISKH